MDLWPSSLGPPGEPPATTPVVAQSLRNGHLQRSHGAGAGALDGCLSHTWRSLFMALNRKTKALQVLGGQGVDMVLMSDLICISMHVFFRGF